MVVNQQNGTTQAYNYGFDLAHRVTSQSVNMAGLLAYPQATANTLTGLSANNVNEQA